MLVDSLHYAESSLTWIFSTNFLVLFIPLLMFVGIRTGSDGFCFPVHRGWNSRDVFMAGLCDYVKESVSFITSLLFQTLWIGKPTLSQPTEMIITSSPKFLMYIPSIISLGIVSVFSLNTLHLSNLFHVYFRPHASILHYLSFICCFNLLSKLNLVTHI